MERRKEALLCGNPGPRGLGFYYVKMKLLEF